MDSLRSHPAHNPRTWAKLLKENIILEGLKSGRIRFLTLDEILESPCLVSSSAPRNPTGTIASKGYPGGRRAWVCAFECWFKKMSYSSLIGTLRRPYQHVARFNYKLPSYADFPVRKTEAIEVRINCWPEHYGLTIWKRPPTEISPEDWEDIARMLAAEIKYRKAKGSANPYEDASVPDPTKRIRDWDAVVEISRKLVLASRSPWKRQNWVNSAHGAIWTVNRLSSPRGRITTSGRWEELPEITIPAPSPFNTMPKIHAAIDRSFHKLVNNYEVSHRVRLNRAIKRKENIVSWWNNLCSTEYVRLQEESELIIEFWKEAENEVREHHGLPRIGEGWVSEATLLQLVKDTFPNDRVVRHARPSWLGRQHLDIFLPTRNVAIEHQGKQHFVPVDFFGGWDGLHKAQKRDKRKRELCAQNGVMLIYCRYDEPITGPKLKALVQESESESNLPDSTIA